MNNQTLWNVCQNQFFRIRLSIRSEDTRKQYKIALDNERDAILFDKFSTGAQKDPRERGVTWGQVARGYRAEWYEHHTPATIAGPPE